MVRRCIAVLCVIFLVSAIVATASYAVEKESFGTKCKKFWQGLFGYTGRVAEESVEVVAEAGKGEAKVVATETKRVGEVLTGDVAKTKELIVEPITGTAETAGKALEGTVKVPVEAAKEE